MKWYGKKCREKQPQTVITPTANNETDYFTRANHWADDLYTSQVAKTQQYRMLSGSLLVLAVVLGLAIITMVPLQKTQLVVVHQSSDGIVWVDPPKNSALHPTSSQTESEIANYVLNREAYSAFSYDHQYQLVNLMSDSKVAEAYRSEQDANNPASPIALLGEDGTRKVQINDVIFLDTINPATTDDASKQHHQNVAQVNFTVTTTNNGETKILPYTALLSWDYRGTPDNPDDKWKNWDGFTVTQYSLNQRNTSQS